jgi:hypothetical protein
LRSFSRTSISAHDTNFNGEACIVLGLSLCRNTGGILGFLSFLGLHRKIKSSGIRILCHLGQTLISISWRVSCPWKRADCSTYLILGQVTLDTLEKTEQFYRIALTTSLIYFSLGSLNRCPLANAHRHLDVVNAIRESFLH